jgi:drug/metabolite transporter (DMT)-like permease
VAQIKQSYRPDSLFLLFGINGVTFCLVFILSILSWQISYFLSFVINHDGFLLDLTCMGVLSSVGSMFSYKLINMFRQHIYPLVANTRKCMTVCVNILWFGHHLALLQWVGVALVFGAILV